jgi:outer membrane receptor protein involved in Fe transport
MSSSCPERSAAGGLRAPTNPQISFAVKLALLCGAIPAYSAQPTSASNEPQLQEVVVTATRREEAITDVPYNIDAVSTKTLENTRATSIADLARLLPGLSYIDQGPVSRASHDNIVMRGLNADPAINNRGNNSKSESTVGSYFGETPVFFPLVLKDIERVEVLRGPQGTLYGSGALGGVIRYLPILPDLKNGFSTAANLDISHTENAGQGNYDIDLALNIPIITDRLGMRLSGGWDKQSGFIDDLARPMLDSRGIPIPANHNDGVPLLMNGFAGFNRVDGINDSKMWWIRPTFLWQPIDTLGFTLRYQHQQTDQSGQQMVSGGFAGGVLDNSFKNQPGALTPLPSGCPNTTGTLAFGFIPVTCLGPGGNSAWPHGSSTYPAAGRYQNLQPIAEPYIQKVDVLSLDINWNLGFATLTSASSAFENNEDFHRDSTGFLEQPLAAGADSLAALYAYYPRLTIIDQLHQRRRSFVQELRLASSWDKPFDYLVGLYYQDLKENQYSYSPWPGINEFCAAAGIAIPGSTSCFGVPGYMPQDPNAGDLTFTENDPTLFIDRAAFGELTYHFTPQWQVTGGIRAFKQDFEANFTQTYPFCGSGCGSGPDGENHLNGVEQKANDQIYKANTSYKLTESQMLYFTFAQGFRRGGVNVVPLGGLQASLPSFATFEPDKANNYELGLKGQLGQRTSYSVAVYDIEWKKFQFTGFTTAGFTVELNGNAARSKGLEAEIHSELATGLTVDVGYAYTNAAATEPTVIMDYTHGVGTPLTTIATINAGARIPNAPETSWVFNGDYAQKLSMGMLHWNLNGSFRGATNSDFEPTSLSFFTMKSFWMWNGSATLETQKNLLVSLYIRNMFNAEGITGGLPPPLVGVKSQGFFMAQPRTIGLNVGVRIR